MRNDLVEAVRRELDTLASPGGSLSGEQRIGLASTARGGDPSNELEKLARLLYDDPAAVGAEAVHAAAESSSDPQTVEAIGIVSRLAALDRLNQVLGVEPEALPPPRPGDPTGEITPGLKRRRGHVPMPPGSIPVALDLVPAEGRAMLALHESLYMSEAQMGNPRFERAPGLNTPQMELMAARVSYHNECFY